MGPDTIATPPVHTPDDPATAPPPTQASAEAERVGARLDAHHSPETNGRMAVCRRCGARTESPEGGRHVPNERLAARSSEWLDAQDRARYIDRARQARNG